LYPDNGLQNQRWRFTPDGQGNYQIVCVHNGGTVEIPDYSNGQQGTGLHISQPNNTLNEKWKIEQVHNGFVFRSAFKPNLVFNVLGGLLEAGKPIGIWPYEGRPNDTFTVTPV
jgi:hypothetical protein